MNLKSKLLATAILLTGLTPLVSKALTLPLSADAHIASVNAGTAVGVNVSPSSKGLLRFDLATLPEGISSKDIAKATLVLFAKTVTTPGKIQASPVLNGWDEATVTSASEPQLGTPIETTADINKGNNYLTLDVTQLVLDWVDNPVSNNGLALTPLTTSQTAFTLDSKEAIQTSHAAFIEVILAGPAGPKGDKGDTGATGQQGNPGLSGYEIVSTFGTVTDKPKNVLAVCPTTKKVIGGGCSVEPDFSTAILQSFPNSANNSYTCTFKASGRIKVDVNAFAICANVN